MNSDKHTRPSDDELDALFRSARSETPSCVEDAGGFGRIEFGFETRLLARLRAERGASWLAWAWRLSPFAAALALAAGAWSWTHRDDSPDTESLYAAVRLAGMPVLDYYLGREE
jgi:hypothetical protein